MTDPLYLGDGAEIIPTPDWYDERSSMTVFHGLIIIAHPEHPPHVWDEKRKQWTKLTQ